MRYLAKETVVKQERIVREASRLFRERGLENVSVGEVMKAARVTHAAFYAHFGSIQDSRTPLARAMLSAVRKAVTRKSSVTRTYRIQKKYPTTANNRTSSP
jgi:AcrR family transcriptional regulator